MNIGIIGSGGREHALCFKLKQSKIVDKIYCIPGNAGTNLIAENLDIETNDFEKIKKYQLKKKLNFLWLVQKNLWLMVFQTILKIQILKYLDLIK